jgi:acyl transferase domain-containing protein
VTEIPEERWDWKAYYGDPDTEPNKTNVKWGGFLKQIDAFDPSFFAISPREAELMDPQQRLFLFLETTWKCIEDGGYKPSDLSGTKTGVFVGVSNSGYREMITRQGLPIESYMATGTATSVIPNRISYLLNLHGPSEPIDTACSSSLVAVHRAVMSIRQGECETAIAGGVNIILSPVNYTLSKQSRYAKSRWPL